MAPWHGFATSYPVWKCCSIIFGTNRDKEEQKLRCLHVLHFGVRPLVASDVPRSSRKWRREKLNGNGAMTRLCYVLSCLEVLQHHLWYQQGQGRTSFELSMSYILGCGHWWRPMCPGARKWRREKLNGNCAI